MLLLFTLVFLEFIVFFHEFGHFLAAKLVCVPVEEFSLGFGPACLTAKSSVTKYSLRVFPIGGYVAFKEDANFLNIRIFKRGLIVLAGPFFNLLLGLVMVAFSLGLQGKYNSTQVGVVTLQGSKIKVGDEIKYVNNNYILDANDLLYEISSLPLNKPINLTVIRNDKELKLLDVGEIIDTSSGPKRTLGITLKVKNLNLLDYFSQVLKSFLSMFKLVLNSIFGLFTGNLTIKDFSGPIGLSRAVGKAGEKGLCSLIVLFAFLSMNVGLFNMIPFLALDGGQFLFLIFEFIFKKPIKKNVQAAANMVGLVILAGLFILITFKDIVSLILNG